MKLGQILAGLEKETTRKDQLELYLKEVEYKLNHNTASMPHDVFEKYKQAEIALKQRLGIADEPKATQHKPFQSQYQKTPPAPSQIIQQPPKLIITSEMIDQAIQTTYFPHILTVGSKFRVDPEAYRNKNNFDLNVANNAPKLEVTIENEIPDLWLGELKITSKTRSEREGEYFLSPSKPVDVCTAITYINYDRERILFTFYDKVEHKPKNGDMFGWTMNTAKVANHPVRQHIFSRRRRAYSDYNDYEQPTEVKLFVKVENTTIYCTKGNYNDRDTVHDFWYYGDNWNSINPTGEGIFKENPQRKLVMENHETYKRLEREGKFM